jgi:hypothetical protein
MMLINRNWSSAWKRIEIQVKNSNKAVLCESRNPKNMFKCIFFADQIMFSLILIKYIEG